MSKTENLRDVVEARRHATNIPGARAVEISLDSPAGRQLLRDHFRTDERLETALRMIERSNNPDDRALAANSLGSFGPPAAAALGRALSRDPSWRVRQHAASSLGKTGDPQVIPVLRAALGDEDRHVRLAAAEALDVVSILSQVPPPKILSAAALWGPAEAQKEEEAQEPGTVVVDLEQLLFASELHARGEKALAEGQFDDALRVFEELLESAPGWANAYSGRGRAHQGLEDWKGAIADHTKAIELDPTLAEAHKHRAICWRSEGEWDMALADSRRATELDDSDAQSWYNLGVTQLHLEASAKALEAFDRAIALRQDYAEAHFNRGVLLIRAGAFEGAVEALSKGISHDPDSAIGFFNRCQAYLQLDDKMRAEADLRRALELDPSLTDRL